MRLSWRILILCLILLLGGGIGIGQAIAARQIDVLGSQIVQEQERISNLVSETKRLKAEPARLALALQEKQAAYDSLRAKQGSTVKELQTLQASFANLIEEYRSLRDDYNALLGAPIGATARELISLREQVSLLERVNSLLHIQVARLTNRLTPAPHHAVAGRYIWGRPEFRSTAWAGRDYELMRKIGGIARSFLRTITFIPGEMDCNDKAVILWNMLLTEGIKSVIVVGNLEMAGETFEESNHAWLFVFNARGEVIYLEATTGDVFFGRLADGSTNPRAIPYREGFIYVRPSDLRRDLKERW